MSEKAEITKKNWALIWTFGIAGQLCWSIEGSWFNNFVYDKIAPNPSIVAWMVAVSATTTTIATFLVGTWSDRVGKRRPFVAVGYILWGIFTVLYGTTEFLPKSSLFLAATAVVAADGIMSFFGSVGFHAGLNPWTTDISNARNRGRVGGVMASLPIITSILAAAISGIIIDAVDFFAFFTIIGALVSAIGILSFFTMRDDPDLKPARDKNGYWRQVLSVFSINTVRKNKELFWLFLFIVIYNIALNVYFPYISIYLVNYIGQSYSLAGIVQAGSLMLAVLFTIPAARLIDKGKMFRVLSVSVAINVIGLFVVFASGKNSLPFLCVGIFATGLGYILNVQTLSAWFKNLLPEGNYGKFEGLRILFSVCIPMILGPFLATGIINRWGIPAALDGIKGMVPSNVIFGISAILTLFVVPPLLVLYRRKRAANSRQAESGLL